MSQRTFLGLTHNPFVPPKEGFFSGADRKTHLEHLRHLSQWSRRILVVSGPFGIGKSTLFRELSANLEPNTKAARLAGTVVTSEREVLSALLQGFGVAADSSAGSDDLSDVIANFVDEQGDNGRNCMVMVDDGHLLEPAALKRLIALVGGSSMRMVVFAETSIIGAIERDTKAAEQEWFEIRLTGFPKSDVRDYLEWRFSQAQYRGLLPFTDEQLETIVTKSSGNPGVVDSLASNLLIEMETGQIRNRGAGFPVMHAVLSVLLLAFVGLLYVWFQQGDAEPSDPVALADQNVNTQPGTMLDAAQAADSAVPQARADETTEDPKGTEDTGSTYENVANEQSADDKDQWIQQEFGAGPEGRRTIGSSTPETGSEGTDSKEDRSRETELAQSDAGGVAVSDPANPAREAVLAENSASQAPAAANPQPPVVDRGPVVVEESQPASVASQEDGQTSDDGRIKDGRWLLDQNPRYYTVQLVTVSRPERARELILEQANPGEFAIYQIRRDGRRLNVITYGVFTSSGAAGGALGDLQGQLGSVKPWVRPMNLVQDAVRGGL
ncbi:MAG: AAA family ATPase [Pseudomonadota bacterium]